MLKSGIHATIAGVVLAFAIPFSAKDDDESPSHRLEMFLQKSVAFIILPIFALANTCIVVEADWMRHLASANSVGIAAGLILGKPLGVTFLCFVAAAIGICRLPSDLKWSHMIGAGILGGIGFTMSIFITNLAFSETPQIINASKMAILLASLTAGVIGFLWLRLLSKPEAMESNTDTMDCHNGLEASQRKTVKTHNQSASPYVSRCVESQGLHPAHLHSQTRRYSVPKSGFT